MKRFINPIKRRHLLCRIRERVNQSNQLGGYRYIGEWGPRVKQLHAQQTNRYNKLRFFWQSPLHVEPICHRCSILRGPLLIVCGIVLLWFVNIYFKIWTD